jgi:hypothetical protein
MAAGSDVILESCYGHVPYRLDSGHKLGEPPSDEVSGNDTPALGERDLAAAKALLGDPDITVEEVARRVGVSPATLYRHLPGGRSALSAAART